MIPRFQISSDVWLIVGSIMFHRWVTFELSPRRQVLDIAMISSSNDLAHAAQSMMQYTSAIRNKGSSKCSRVV